MEKKDTRMSTSLNKIDTDLALERAGGNPDLAQDLYKMLQTELPAYSSNITQSFDSRDYASLQAVVHKLNGAATYCGVPALKEAASSLESDLKANKEDNYAAGYEAVIGEIQALMDTPSLPL